jgi:hypothetical protein
MPVPAPRASRPSPDRRRTRRPFGRVDDDGTVSVREGDEWRVVGQYPDGTPAEALAYFERKYVDLAGEVTLLEVRHRNGGASASDLRSTLATVRERVVGAAAVGDLAALEARLGAGCRPQRGVGRRGAGPARGRRRRHRRAHGARRARRSDRRPRPQVDPVEADDRRGRRLFEQWQAHQATGPRLPKSTGQQLWKRFRDARATLDKHRREFYAGLDEQHRRRATPRRASSSAPRRSPAAARTASAPTARCSTSGRARVAPARRPTTRCGRASRRPATRCTPPARSRAGGCRGVEKIEAKRALLARPPRCRREGQRQGADAADRHPAPLGRDRPIFPREAERALDDDLRKIEQGVKAREDADWKSNNPETKARQNDMTQQLRDAIAALEADLEKAKASKDAGRSRRPPRPSRHARAG